MKRVLSFVAVAFLLFVNHAVAQEWAKERLEKSPRHLEFVKVKNGNREVTCFIAYPEVKEKAPAVLVIHEIFGLSDWVRSVTDQLAEAGYIAIAPDLLSGAGPGGGGTSEFKSGDDVRGAVVGLPADQVTKDLTAVQQYVTELPACNGKIAVAGFCWGGGQSFRFATNSPELKAAFVFYGPPPEDVSKVSCPVYGFYGENDARINMSIPKTKEMMQTAKKEYDPVIYKGAGHGFMRAGEAPDAKEADRKARDEAWERWKELLGKL
jgi:carboxymethylenebutenolidase